MASFGDVAKRLVLCDQRVELKKGQAVPIREDQGKELTVPDYESLRAERESPLTCSESALDVMRVLDAGQRSLEREGASVSLDLEPTRFGSPDRLI